MAATNLLAMTIPWVELIAGLALIAGVRPRAGAIVYTVLLAVFTIGVARGAGARPVVRVRLLRQGGLGDDRREEARREPRR